jgi:hypothetical protein
MKTKKNRQCQIMVTGKELEELKRHANNIPGCPGLDKRIQKYQGDEPFVLTIDELGWLVAVLDGVLTEPQGYACIEPNSCNLKYLPASDPRCKTCKQLYERLNKEYDQFWNLQKKDTRYDKS